MKPAILLVAATLIFSPVFADETEDDLGEGGVPMPAPWEASKEGGRTIAKASDAIFNSSLVVGCLNGSIGFKINYSTDTLQSKYVSVPEGEITFSVDTITGTYGNIMGTSLPSKGFAASYGSDANQPQILRALEEMIKVSADDTFVVSVSGPRGTIETVMLSGAGTTRSLGAVLKECGH